MDAIKFGRWLLKYATPHWDADNSLCWLYGDKEYDTNELYDIFTKTKK